MIFACDHKQMIVNEKYDSILYSVIISDGRFLFEIRL